MSDRDIQKKINIAESDGFFKAILYGVFIIIGYCIGTFNMQMEIDNCYLQDYSIKECDKVHGWMAVFKIPAREVVEDKE